MYYPEISYESPFDPTQGRAISLHQPWATMIMTGFKRLEGRDWFQDYSGPLWIHAASKEPDSKDCENVKQYYAELYEKFGLPTPAVPTSFPTSCLLGVVDCEKVVDTAEAHDVICAKSKADARFRAGKGEWVPLPEDNGSNYVFILSKPRRLVVPVEMGGQHKLWSLPDGMAQRLLPALRPVKFPIPDTQ
jgi:hypothetical protein